MIEQVETLSREK